MLCLRVDFFKVIVVLIYPYWNVNEIKYFVQFADRNVLIYPYWNVNHDFVLVPELFDTRFNLSILECKYETNVRTNVRQTVLIYPYWNVNGEQEYQIAMEIIVLIYPYWNVNVQQQDFFVCLAGFNLSILECK